MVDEVIFVIFLVINPIIGPIGAACGIRLFRRACKAQHAWVDIIGEGRHDLRGVAGGIDRDKDGLHGLVAPLEDINRLGIAHRIQWADIGAECIAEIQQGWLGQHIGIRHGLARFTDQLEWATDCIGPTCNHRAAALRENIIRARTCAPEKGDHYSGQDQGNNKDRRAYGICSGHDLLIGGYSDALITYVRGTINSRSLACDRKPRAMATPNDPSLRLLSEDARSGWVRLETLLFLRWLAVLGQTITVVIASFYLGLRLELGLCFLAIGTSVLSNLIAMSVFPRNQRLSDRDAMLTLLFDLTQLSFLLFLTGGLNNPFALLILAPVTISATALTLGSTLFLGGVAVVMISAIAVVHLPLRTGTDEILQLPLLFVIGFWTAIVIGIVFLSAYARRVTGETHSMNQALLATQMALAREQKLTDLGGVVAAAAHELGTPLATIKLVSSELADELSDRPELFEDVQLIREQADRCRDIMRSMGRAGKDDLHMRSAPLSAVVREAAEPHSERGIKLLYDFAPFNNAVSEDDSLPTIYRKPEIIHGLRNLVQNAVDFAKDAVWVETRWNDSEIRIRVIDDGAGYPSDLLGRLGDPFLRRRKPDAPDEGRPGYEGMGLGLFIAKTLLERSGATVTFQNASDPFLLPEDRETKTGAMVDVIWPFEAISLSTETAAAALGDNRPIEI